MKKMSFSKTLLINALFFLFSSFIYGQTIRGKIVGVNGESIPFANIIEKGTTNGTTSNENGEFSLNVKKLPTVVTISSLGFVTIERNVVSADTFLQVTLREDSDVLEEVVISGLATTTKRSNLANTVSTISAAELTQVTSQSGFDSALSGKFTGAEIKANSGAPGGGISMRLRGVTSVFGDQQPLFIVDGVYVDNSSIGMGNNVISEASGGGNPSTNQDDASNRIADIDPEDIENVEILKGASAAAIYGSRAAGGVVIITTKRGKFGKPRISFSQTLGLRSPTQLLGLRDWNEERVFNNFYSPKDDPVEDAESRANAQAIVARFNQAVANGGLRDYEAELFDHTRISTTTRFTSSGGSEKTDYFFGVTYKDEPGLVENTGYEKASVRLNIGQKFTDWLDLYVTSNYISSQSDRGFFNNGNANRTVGYALAFTYPWENLSPIDGLYPSGGAGSNVLETVAITTNREKVNRFIGSATSNIKIIDAEKNKLKLVLQAGFDQYTLRTTSIFPRELSYFRDPSTLSGVAVSGSTINTNYNLSAFLVHNLNLEDGLQFTTQLGSFFQDFDRNTVITIGTGFDGSLTNLSLAKNLSSEQTIRLQKDSGFFIQEEINYKNKIIGSVGIRGDKSTNNGESDKMYYYPKANLAINLHEFDFWKFDKITTFKPRIAYGEAGRFPQFNDQFTLAEAQFIGGNSGFAPGTFKGDPFIEPERQKELEYGLDLGLFESRIILESTFYTKKIDDLLIQERVPTSTGFTREIKNGGELKNTGIELGLKANVIEKEDFSWDTNLKWWKNKSKITRLDVPAFTEGGFASSLGTFYIQEGFSATQIVGTYDSDAYTAEEIARRDPEGDGFFVYGNAEPDFQMSWQNNFKYKNFDLSFLWHWKKGGDGINLTTLLYDLAGTTWDYDDTGLDPTGTLTNGEYRASQAFVNPEPLIEDAGYLRLREVGLFYTFNKDVIKGVEKVKIGVSGRNLINIFDYNSYDPEASNFGNNVLANNVEVTPYPASKFINFHLNVNF
ncbi:SusC/RagA family TonB-linked outer membrane protein [Tenacibaculum singaporense]|uniref:SusC/RagA family TonB-linked outer membrane protein n=1 Tax=Tenacibaculum singaporense TaxID=2358479 RepID=A0A3Q8RQJ5_9FLAO|nr:SusC/RagA family TonB-linked outer membrane protein [Tenacibaculum singaporense]AZJ34732.1 SusC/RagA family TonB-linked outer membrane protein [Tenacibaculum singaporense]